MYCEAGISATADAAAWAKLLLLPTTKASNVYSLFRVDKFDDFSAEVIFVLFSPVSSFVSSKDKSITVKVQSLFVILPKALMIRGLNLFSIKSFW